MTATLPAGRLMMPGPLRLLIPWMGAALSILVISLLLARYVTASLRSFAAAADRVGRDLGATPLTEAGPAEVRSVVRAFNLMQMRLRRFVSDRTQMLAAISHDLMTPISRLRLRTEMLRPSVERARMLSDLALMERIVSTTLDFAREDVTAERRQRLDLGSLVQAVCDEFADGGGAVTYEGPDYVEITAAPIALARAVRNVVENAIKYAGGCAVRLTIANAVAQIVVADDGPGIPTSELEQVFEPFYRLDRARTGEQGGSGLGLAIARGVLRAHGGDVTLANNRAGGLRATLSLPLSQSA